MLDDGNLLFFQFAHKRRKSAVFVFSQQLARLLQCFMQQRIQGVFTMTTTVTSKIAALALTVLVSATLVLGAVGPATTLATPTASAHAAA